MTIGHLAIGFAAGRVQARTRRDLIGQLLAFGMLSVLPDADLVALVLHRARAVLGHRGVTHSLIFAAVIAALVAVFVPQLSRRSSRLRTGIVAFGVVASHGVLDPLIAHSTGTRLWWPLTAARVTWGSFQPIPDAFTGLRWPYLSASHLAVELLISSPALLYAFWPRQVRVQARDVPRSRSPERVRVDAPAEQV